ncbi:MAG TPA: formate dehydrogenase subunit delta [Zoogloea sp.]|uniref:formate dehydrogenase subunit delta n=1 Tax=Zoogloea sp. TaxID=49181 RepID=UPI002BD8BAE8|nr:formate dehydrogenase subunit delta [Zoogloea sp.]HMV16706.1 formate dehydrogenase subunit delta [Rhodocyclaceae bacterium]HMV61856.1 formate dehydrogenase subunit delta [Rhodocyclaceae bacterium]HMW52138.1 formate dehydrogenase subunit delta [Rhodocyclaceae bacterium]HMY48114.1 formate dehydrogenase subunit delta [Rhodocyclaceae bacterium]HMZ74679.1 formate dehydrogenase subunit delta [Rhodocyclaceae bacterium]
MNEAKLVNMANQIATAVAANAEPARAAIDVAEHLMRFWDPRMRAGLIACAGGAAGLDPLVREAVARLRDQAQATA